MDLSQTWGASTRSIRLKCQLFGMHEQMVIGLGRISCESRKETQLKRCNNATLLCIPSLTRKIVPMGRVYSFP